MKEFSPSIKQIACIDRTGILGINTPEGSSLVFNIKEDMKFFKNTTKKSVVIMGKTTYNSLPSPLKDRISIVLSSKMEKVDSKDFYIRNTLDECLVLAEYLALYHNYDIYVIGGSTLYEQTLPFSTELIFTYVDISIKNKISLKPNSEFIRYPSSEELNNFELVSNERLNSTNFIYPLSIMKLRRKLQSKDS